MAATQPRKRKFEASSVKARLQNTKKPKKQKRYDSDSSEEGSEDDTAFVARDAPRKRSNEAVPSKSAAKPVKKQPKNLPAAKSMLEESSESDGESDDDDLSSVTGGGQLEDDNDKAGVEEDITDGGDSSDTGDDEEVSDVSGSESEGDDPQLRKKTKRHDPSAFANSLSTILSSKLPTSKRVDPVLSRSREAQEAGHELAEGKLEAKAKRKIREEKRLATEKGRVKDVLLGEVTIDDAGAMSAADIAEQERRLRKTAQRGVVKLFNAVRMAQVKSEEAARQNREQGVVGDKKREQKVGEMGRNAFLEMVGAGAQGS